MKSLGFQAKLCFALGLALVSHSAEAQVVYSFGVQEVYDDNVFLESNDKVSPQILGEMLPPGVDPATLITERSDGDPDEDFITNLTLGVSSALPIHQYARGSVSATLGSILFADQSDENRLTGDGHLSLKTTEQWLPTHLGASFDSGLRSGSNSLRTAQGTASRTSQELDNTLSIYYAGVPVSQKTSAGAEYALRRHDFLGEFLLSSDDDRDGTPQSEENGADYFVNSAKARLDHQFTQFTTGGLSATVENYTFTDVASEGPVLGSDELDRTDFLFDAKGGYTASEKLQFNAGVGLTVSSYKEDLAPTTRTIIDEDGSTRDITIERDSSASTLRFDVGTTFIPVAGTTLGASVSQNVGTDIDGRRVVGRTVALNFAQDLGERLNLAAGGSFSQYDDRENLSSSTERFETGVSLNYSITEAIILALGWNYANQTVDSIENSSRFTANDYEVNRVFVGLNAGLVGLGG